jgi:hypothetical protein
MVYHHYNCSTYTITSQYTIPELPRRYILDTGFGSPKKSLFIRMNDLYPMWGPRALYIDCASVSIHEILVV